MGINQTVFKKTLQGVGAMALREVVALPIGLLVSIALARLLTPAEFGTFATAFFLIIMLGSATEIGLGMTLIQQKEEPTVRELRTYFTFRGCILGLMLVLLWALAPFVASLFRLGPDGARFVQFLALSVVILPLNSGSQVLLNRRLAYPALATIDFFHGLSYQVVAVFLAWKGYGLWGLGVAHLVSWAVRALLLFWSAPWPLGFAWDWAFLRRGFVYGGQVQLSGMTSLARDNIAVLLAGPMFGPQAVGYLNWGTKIVQQASQLFTTIVTRVSFPSFARLQGDSDALSAMMRAILRYVNLLTLPVLACICALAPEIVEILYTNKWAPGIPVLYLLAVRMVSGNLVTPFDSLLKATGRAGASLKIASLWTALEWLLCLGAVLVFNFLGVAVGYAIGGWIAAIWLLLEVGRFTRLDLRYCLLRPALAAAAVVPVLLWLKAGAVASLFSLVALAALGFALFWLFLWAVERMGLLTELRSHAALVRRALAREA